MTKISFFYDKNDNPTGFEFLGHAGFSESGTDIVCAAISTLVLNTVNSVEKFSKTDFEVEQDKKKGRIYFSLKEDPDPEAIVLLKSLKLGIGSIRDSYGKKYIRIEK